MVCNESDARTLPLLVTLGLGAALVGFTALVGSLVARDGTGSRFGWRATVMSSPLCLMLSLVASLTGDDAQFEAAWGLVGVAAALVFYSTAWSRMRAPPVR